MQKLISSLKENGEDFEFYPTTKEIIARLVRDVKGWQPSNHWDRHSLCSVLDIGAGNGKVLEALRVAECGLSEFYAIEKSPILCGQLPESVYVVGTVFEEQSLISKAVDVIFCNPPYSDFESWAVKIIRQAASKVVYLVLPERWERSEEIKAALAARDSKARSLGSFDFESAEDRQARAKVQLLRVDVESSEDDAFESFFASEFAELHAKFTKDEKEDEEKTKEKAEADDKAGFASLVPGENYVEAMVNLYGAAMARIQRNYQLIAQLDVRLLREFGISPASVCKLLKERLKGLRVLYWHELFSKMRPVTDRLTAKSRNALLGTLQKNVHVDFTVSNIHVVLIWALRNANRFVESQFLETYEYMVDKCNVTAYKSNHKVFTCDNWRYRRNEGGEQSENSHFKLEYRIVMSSCGGLSSSSYSWESREGLCERAHNFVQDLLTVANNLGFLCSSSLNGYSWRSNCPHTFFFRDRAGKECELFEVRAFKNQNMHLRLSRRFALALNVEHGRLRGWLRTPAEAVQELQEKDAGKYWGATFRLLPDSGMKFLPAASFVVPDAGSDDFASEESAPVVVESRAARAVAAPVARVPLDLIQKFMACVPDFRARIQGVARVAGLPWADVFTMWREYSEKSFDQSALVSEFLTAYAQKLGGDLKALQAAERGELGLAA